MRRAILATAATAAVVGATPSSSAKYPQGIKCHKKYTVHDALVYARKVMPTPTKGQNSRLDVLQWCQRHPGRRKTIYRWRLRHEQPSGWAIPAYIVMCESGGRNTPPNYASASGYYQIIYSTWHAYGGGRYASEAWRATKAQQDEIARRIWRSDGAGAWDCA